MDRSLGNRVSAIAVSGSPEGKAKQLTRNLLQLSAMQRNARRTMSRSVNRLLRFTVATARLTVSLYK